MIGLFLIVFINLLAAVITFITAKDTIIKEKKLQLSGWVLSILFLLSIGLAICQHIYTETQNETNEKAAKQREEESNDRIIKTFTSSLAEYGLKYDSTQKIIEKMIKDSSRRSTTIVQENQPIFSVCPGRGISIDELKKDTTLVSLKFCLKNTPYNIEMDVFFFSDDNERFTFMFRPGKFSIKSGLEIDGGVTKGPFLFVKPSQMKSLCIFVRGRYTNRDKTRIYNIENAYYYHFASKTFGIITNPDFEEIRNAMKLNNLY